MQCASIYRSCYVHRFNSSSGRSAVGARRCATGEAGCPIGRSAKPPTTGASRSSRTRSPPISTWGKRVVQWEGEVLVRNGREAALSYTGRSNDVTRAWTGSLSHCRFTHLKSGLRAAAWMWTSVRRRYTLRGVTLPNAAALLKVPLHKLNRQVINHPRLQRILRRPRARASPCGLGVSCGR